MYDLAFDSQNIRLKSLFSSELFCLVCEVQSDFDTRCGFTCYLEP